MKVVRRKWGDEELAAEKVKKRRWKAMYTMGLQNYRE